MGKQWKQCQTLFWGASKITADGDCSHEIKRRLLLGRKTNLDSIFKSRDITLSAKVHIFKAMVFPVVMYGCESWTSHKEGWAPKNWCFWTVVKTLESPLDCMEVKLVNSKGNQSWVFLGLMLKVKLQYFGHLMSRADSFEKTLMLGKIEAGRRRGRQRMRWFDGISDSMDMSLRKFWEAWRRGKPGVLQFLGSQKVGYDWGTEQ